MNASCTILSDKRISKWLLIFSLILMGATLATLYGYVFLNLDKLNGQSLVTTAHCPSCNGIITMWDQIASPEPDMVHCPECNKLIQESVEYFGVLKLAVLTSFVLIILTIILSATAKEWRRMWRSFIVFLIYWALLELGTNLLLFNYAELTIV